MGLVVLIGVYQFGYTMGRRGYVFVPRDFKVINQSSQPQTVDYNLLWDAINTVNTNYIDKSGIDQQQILYGAVKGAVAAVGDPYTTFFTPVDLNNFQTGLKGSFDGIGAEVGEQNGNIVIVAPLDGSPAQKAGLKAKDIIAKVDGASTAGWSVDQAVSKIRGPKGTKVTLTIVRDSKALPDITITRDVIVVKSVKWEFKTETQNGVTKKIAVITINQYGDDTKDLFGQAVNDILRQNVQGIIVDERNNPGGYLQTAVGVASAWVDSGKVVVTEAHSDGSSIKYNAEGNNRLSGIKTVILINGGSASAAEIFAGALHDYKIAELVGDKSFGKGSVQQLVDLKEGGAVKVTVAKWITPGGINLNHSGLDPDVKVDLSDSDVAAGKDPQMDSAVREVTK